MTSWSIARRYILPLSFLLVPVLAIAQDKSSKKAEETETSQLECMDTAVLWRIEHGEKHYAKAYCEAGCANYHLDGSKSFTKDELAKCVKGVKETTKEFYKTSRGDLQCLDIKRDIQLIRAWHGRKFDGVAWKSYFKKHYDWYGKRPKTKYSSEAISLRLELEKLRATCPKMNKDQKRYASTLISALKRGRVSGKTPILALDMEAGDTLEVLRGKARNEVVSLGYERMRDYAPDMVPTTEPKTLADVFSDGQFGDASFKYRDLEYTATIEIGGEHFSQYCNTFHGDEECGSGGRYTTYYFNKDAEIIAVSTAFVACPFVYTRDESEAWSYQGEILRNLRRPELESAQTLDVVITPGECERGVIMVKLTEEKPETTYLDQISLQVGSHRITPTQCQTGPEQMMCGDDARYHVIERGDELELEFALTQEARAACLAGQVTLHADGYYIPTTSR